MDREIWSFVPARILIVYEWCQQSQHELIPTRVIGSRLQFREIVFTSSLIQFLLMPSSSVLLAKRALVSLLGRLAVAYNVTISVSRDSSDDKVTAAYRKVVLKVHPDKGGARTWWHLVPHVNCCSNCSHQAPLGLNQVQASYRHVACT